jgi:hypothetical protein
MNDSNDNNDRSAELRKTEELRAPVRTPCLFINWHSIMGVIPGDNCTVETSRNFN